MTGAVTVDTGATDQVAAAISAAAVAFADPSDLLREVAQRVASDAASRAPRATGALAGSMTAAGATVNGLPTATLTWGVRYAAFVNFGTDRMPARPFATDALTAAAADAEPLLADWAGRIIDGI